MNGPHEQRTGPIRRCAALGWLLAGLCLLPSLAGARDRSHPVLILASQHTQSRLEQEQIEGLLSVLPPDVEVLIDYLDVERINRRKRYPDYYETLLFAKYKTRKLAAVVALNDEAIRVVAHYRPHLFSHPPVLVCGSSPSFMADVPELDAWTGVFCQPDMEQAVKGVLALHPDAQSVHVLGDEPLFARSTKEQLERLVSASRVSVPVQVMYGQGFWAYENLVKYLGSLRPDSVVFFERFYQQIGGGGYVPDHLLPQLSRESNVPIYTTQREAVGVGAIGGLVVDGREMGRRLGELVMRVLEGAAPAAIPSVVLDGEWVFDDVQLKRWGISDGQLPKGSRILNRPTSFFQEHKWVLLGGGLIVLLELTIIALLLLNRAGRLRAQRALQTSEKRYRSLFEVSEDLFMIMDREGTLLHVNPAVERLLGYAAKDLVGHKQAMICVPADRARAQAHVVVTLGGERTVLELLCLTKDGKEIPMEFLYQPFEGDGGAAVVCFARNLTERINLQHLTQEISERERQNIGYDIHDGLGQYLSALIFQCHRLEQGVAANKPVESTDMTRLTSVVTELAFEVRSLARSLVPLQMLARSLETALLELIEINKRHFHVEAQMEFALDEHRLLPEVASQLYRIAQEAMRNAVRHASATTVRVVLREAGNEAELIVENDGPPFQFLPERRSGMGLAIMEHRARLIRAHLSIRPGASGGARVECRIPLVPMVKELDA